MGLAEQTWRREFTTRLQTKEAVLAGFFLATTFIFHSVIFGWNALPQFCCDANRYLAGADAFLKHFVFADVTLGGYRSIIVYGLIACLQWLGSLAVDPSEVVTNFRGANSDAAYLVGSYAIFLIFGLGLIFCHRRLAIPLPLVVALYCNPVAVAYVSMPLQESLYVLFLIPMLLVTFGRLQTKQWAHSAFYLLAFAVFAYALKPSFLPMSLALSALAVPALWRLNGRKKLDVLGLSLAVAAFLLIPMSAASMHFFDTIRPYPNQDVLSFQFKSAWEMWRYETLLIDGAGVGRAFSTPFRSGPAPLTQLLQQPADAILLMLGHVVGAFDYSTLQTYIVDTELPRPFFANLFIGFISAGGIIYTFRYRQRYNLEDILLDVILVTTLAPLPLLAVESRFALIPVLILCIRFAQWIQGPRPTWQYGAAVVVGVTFSLLTFTQQANFQAGDLRGFRSSDAFDFWLEGSSEAPEIVDLLRRHALGGAEAIDERVIAVEARSAGKKHRCRDALVGWKLVHEDLHVGQHIAGFNGCERFVLRNQSLHGGSLEEMPVGDRAKYGLRL